VTLADFALLVDATRKWVLNTRAVLGSGVRYSLAVAERMALVRVLNRDLSVPLPRAWDLAGDALAESSSASGLIECQIGGGSVSLSIDVRRLRSALATRRSLLSTMPPRRRAGRKPKRVADPLAAAREYGLDVTLLEANLARHPAQRLRQLDDMAAFTANVRRGP
jgi:hypothetical protein